MQCSLAGKGHLQKATHPALDMNWWTDPPAGPELVETKPVSDILDGQVSQIYHILEGMNLWIV